MMMTMMMMMMIDDDEHDNNYVDAFYLVDVFYQERMRIISSGAENIRNVFRSTREYVLR